MASRYVTYWKHLALYEMNTWQRRYWTTEILYQARMAPFWSLDFCVFFYILHTALQLFGKQGRIFPINQSNLCPVRSSWHVHCENSYGEVAKIMSNRGWLCFHVSVKHSAVVFWWGADMSVWIWESEMDTSRFGKCQENATCLKAKVQL